jgi:putative oxidoreductase
MKRAHIIYWVCRLGAALIMLQTLYFKFSGAAESVYIFQTVGMEPWGRIGVGILELIASVLLLINSKAWVGAALAVSLMIGAIGMHAIFLGISVQGDGGQLFIYAVLVLLFSLYVLFVNKEKVVQAVKRFV